MTLYFTNVSELLTMGGHGFYVWLAYGFSLLWITYLLLSPLCKKNRLLERVRQQQQFENQRHQSPR